MTLRHHVRLLPIALVAAATVAVSAPAEAATQRTTFAQPTPIYVGDQTAGSLYSEDAITIPDGAATPYPSTVTSSRPGVIDDVNVWVYGLDHANVDDLQLLLVGPGGQQALLMAHAGGTSEPVYFGFDDEADTAVPDDGPIESWSAYRPAAYAPTALPAPAPALSGNSALSVFDGTSPVGQWKLYVHDSATGNEGSIGSWGLDLSTRTTPYPSTVDVSGVGVVSDVNVTLKGFTSEYPDDIDALLVGPQGQQATLMSDVGGGTEVADLTLTFDDEAAAHLPESTELTSGAFKPTNDDEDDAYPAPAPAPTYNTSLSVFDGTNPNGAWRLFLVDQYGSDFTEVLGGWSLDLEWTDSAAPTGSVSVAGGAAAVPDRDVTLTLSATDPVPGAGVKQVRFSNDGSTWSAPQPYAATATWSLAAGKDGARTVHAQFIDGAGNVSAVVTDSVVLDTAAPTAKKVKPAEGAHGVSPKAKIKIVANERLDKTTVSKKTVTLKLAGKKVKAKVSLKKGKTIVLKPKKPLADGTYKVKVGKKVTDLAGNAFDAKKKKGTQTLKWSFTV